MPAEALDEGHFAESVAGRGAGPRSLPDQKTGLFEEMPHDLPMARPDAGPHRAGDGVFVLHEGGEEQRVLLALEEHFGRQPEARAGAEERDVGGVAPHLPAEHESVRPS